MQYYPVKLQRNLCAVSVRVLAVNVRALCLFALLFSVSDSDTGFCSKGGNVTLVCGSDAQGIALPSQNVSWGHQQ